MEEYRSLVPGAAGEQQPERRKAGWLKRNGWKIFLVILLLLGVLVYFKYYYVYSNHSSISGKMQKISKKGVMFKTWEGYLYTTVSADGTTGLLSPKEWRFSVTNDSIAHVLEGYVGKNVVLHYHQYLGRLPWRGDSKYIVHGAELFR